MASLRRAAGAVGDVVVLPWFYVSGIAILTGAELNADVASWQKARKGLRHEISMTAERKRHGIVSVLAGAGLLLLSAVVATQHLPARSHAMMKFSKAIGWPAGRTPLAPAGFDVTPLFQRAIRLR